MGRRECGWQLDHGIERAGIGRQGSVFCWQGVRSAQEWGQRGGLGQLELRQQFGHGVERTGIVRHCRVLFWQSVCGNSECIGVHDELAGYSEPIDTVARNELTCY